MNGASSRRCSRWWRFTRGCCIRLSPQLGSLWYYWWCFTLRYVYTCLCEKRVWSTGGHSYTLFFPSFPLSFEPLVQRGLFLLIFLFRSCLQLSHTWRVFRRNWTIYLLFFISYSLFQRSTRQYSVPSRNSSYSGSSQKVADQSEQPVDNMSKCINKQSIF